MNRQSVLIRVTFSCVLLIPFASNAFAQDDLRRSRLEELFTVLEENDKFMGTAAVSIKGRVIFQRQCGIRLPEASDRQNTSDQKANAETQYRIGSITKVFTAVMIMQLIEEQKLSLTSKLSEFYPSITNADSISIGQMLSHRSGIGSITSDPTYRRWSTTEQSRQQMIEIVSRQPKRFEPGKRAEYSNSNYVLLGLIIEKVTDSDYAEQLKTRICEPAKLTRTEYMTKAGPKNNVARAFFRADGQWKPQTETHPSVPHGAGAIMSTATDLIRFAEALFAGKLISKVSLKKMKPDGLGMGSGLFAYPYGVKRSLGHGGSIDRFQSMLGYFLEDKVAFAVISNGIDYRLNDINLDVLAIVFDKPYSLPKFGDE